MNPPNSVLAGETDALGGVLRPCSSVAATDPPARQRATIGLIRGAR